MWPYDEYTLGAVHYSYDSELNALHVKDEDGDFYCIYGGDLKPDKTLSGVYSEISWDEGELNGRKTDLNQVYHSAVYVLNKENDHCLNYCMVGTNQGRDESINHYHHLLNHPQDEYNNTVSHYQNLLDNFVTFKSPDEEFNRLWKWALIGTDRFCAYTPPLGTALLAGFSTTARGWNGRHKISGRPGYAWYFGRDSEWSGFAINDYGDFDLVKKQIEFLQKFQDLSGKIFHELSTSGVVHYDAADATPLYIILVAHYLRASGDIEFVRSSWPHIEKAMLFLYSTDTDDDRLIENTNVGHGWVEGGKLWGANTTFYLAALWAQTLKDAAYIADHLGKSELEKKYIHDSERVQKILNTDFYNEKDQFYYYGKFANGDYNREKTVLPAVGMYFNLLDETRSKEVLQQYAGNAFSSDWGVRILSSKSSLFNPRGYHYGSVWPLFTGWTALAEYEYGRSVQGFIHICDNMFLKNHWASGFVEEVMNGAEYTPSGVCPHQCWSETNILHPAITGMIGWKPFAPESKVILKPRFPLHWADVTVNNLAIGNARIKLQMTRQKNETKFRVFLTEGMPIKILFAPEIAAGTIIEEITINDKRVDIPSGLMRGLIDPPLEFDLNQVSDIVFKHTKGVGMIPQMTQPNPGGMSEGYRIISTILDKNKYEIVFEGRSGTKGNFKVMIFDQAIKSINGASFDKIGENGINQITVTFPSSNQEYVKNRVIIEL
jgi:glycogen debranching enzyme